VHFRHSIRLMEILLFLQVPQPCTSSEVSTGTSTAELTATAAQVTVVSVGAWVATVAEQGEVRMDGVVIIVKPVGAKSSPQVERLATGATLPGPEGPGVVRLRGAVRAFDDWHHFPFFERGWVYLTHLHWNPPSHVHGKASLQQKPASCGVLAEHPCLRCLSGQRSVYALLQRTFMGFFITVRS